MFKRRKQLKAELAKKEAMLNLMQKEVAKIIEDKRAIKMDLEATIMDRNNKTAVLADIVEFISKERTKKDILAFIKETTEGEV